MSWERSWAEAETARRFVERLASLGPSDRRPPVAPVLDRDPFLSAWTNVESALGEMPEPDRARVQALLADLDRRVEALDLLPSLRQAARRAVRGLLARPWLLTPESLGFVYQPFESVIPMDSLGE